MMAAPYPPPSQYSVNMSPTHGTPNPGSAHVGHAPFGYPTPSPHPHHSQLYCSPVPEFTTFNNVTPPTVTPSQFGSPLIASGYPHPGGTPTPHQWGTLNALSLSPMGTLDSSIAYGYPHPSPVLGHDPAGAGAGACAAPGEVFSAIPIRHDHMGPDALGFHHPVYPPHPGPVFRGHHGLKAGPNGHIILGVDGQPTGEIKKRSRTAQACERCRIRKARCFGGNPCNRCTKRRFQCEFSTAVRQRGGNKPAAGAAAAGGASSSASTASTSVTGKPNSLASSTSAASSSSGPGSPAKAGTDGRRLSLPEGPSQEYIPHAPSKSYSTTEVPRLSPVSEEVNGRNRYAPMRVVSSSGEFLSVPPGVAAGPGGAPAGPRTDSYFPHPQTATHTPAQVQAPTSAAGSPMFAYTPDMDATPTTGSDSCPYTPISPATTFSPTLGVAPPVTGPAYLAHGYINA